MARKMVCIHLLYFNNYRVLWEFNCNYIYPFLVSRVILLLNFKKIPLLNIGLNIEVIDSIESLQVLLIELNETKCCRGVVPSVDCVNTKEILDLQYVEYDDQRWHKNCLTVLNESKE